jgi:hypothetical protein
VGTRIAVVIVVVMVAGLHVYRLLLLGLAASVSRVWGWSMYWAWRRESVISPSGCARRRHTPFRIEHDLGDRDLSLGVIPSGVEPLGSLVWAGNALLYPTIAYG